MKITKTEIIKIFFKSILRQQSGLVNNNAFTLSEVLITLGIIGVIAAITIPGLITNYKAKRLRTQFLKSYSVIQQAFKRMEYDEVSLDPRTYTNEYYFYKTFSTYFTGANVCDAQTSYSQSLALPCYNALLDRTKTYKTLDGNVSAPWNYFDDGQIALPDGSLILFENAKNASYNAGSIWLSVDLNGFSNPPNRWGYDLFTFEFQDGELKTMGDRTTKFHEIDKYCNSRVSNSYNGIACAQKAKENSDYFKSLVKEFK